MSLFIYDMHRNPSYLACLPASTTQHAEVTRTAPYFGGRRDTARAVNYGHETDFVKPPDETGVCPANIRHPSSIHPKLNRCRPPTAVQDIR